MFKASKTSLYNFKTMECKKRWYEENVTKSVARAEASDAMNKGIYFEILALGESLTGDEVPDMSFLRTKKGDKSVELIRIEEQAERFKELFDPSHEDFLGFTITDTQIRSEDERTKGVFDFLCKDEFDRDCLFDLKFTADVESTYGDFAWGRDPQDIDWTQQILYEKLYEKEYGKKPRMFVMVFDASPRKGIKLFELKLSESAVEEVFFNVELMFDAIEKYKENDAPVSPSEKNCKDCLVDCPFRYVEPKVKIIKASI